MRTFKALQTFEAPESKSTYIEGLSYTIVDNNHMLNALAEVWALQGKVEFLHSNSNQSKLKGKGQVDTTFLGLTKAAWRSLWR